MRRLLAILFLGFVLVFPIHVASQVMQQAIVNGGAAAFGPISRTGKCGAVATSCTLSAAATGNLNLFWAWHSTAGVPSLPAGYTSIASGSLISGSYLLYCKTATSSADTGSGTATSATDVGGVSYAGANTIGSCANAVVSASASVMNASSSTSVSYGGITLKGVSGTSWVVGLAASSAGGSCSTANMTGFQNTSLINLADTNGTVTSWSTQSCSVSSENWMTYTVEILQ